MKLKTNRIHKGSTETKSFFFAIKVVRVCKKLITDKEFVMSKQLLRSGTAVGAISREAKNAESIKDFIHKLSMAQKEADETLFWIDLLYETDFINQNTHSQLYEEALELMRIISKSIITSKKKLNLRSK